VSLLKKEAKVKQKVKKVSLQEKNLKVPNQKKLPHPSNLFIALQSLHMIECSCRAPPKKAVKEPLKKQEPAKKTQPPKKAEPPKEAPKKQLPSLDDLFSNFLLCEL